MKQTLKKEDVELAYQKLKSVVYKTPLELNKRLSKKFGAQIYLKREDLQIVRSYKLRGAFNAISNLSRSDLKRGIVCASAGNHAQGVAFSCNRLKVKGDIFIPKNTPNQKVDRVKTFGDGFVNIFLVGDTFDDANALALKHCKEKKKIFIHPFDDFEVIKGQGTVAVEIMRELEGVPDYVVVPVGGGGLIAGVSTYMKGLNKNIKIVGVEPTGAPSMTLALKAKEPVTLQKIEKFIDGAAVKTVGNKNFALLRNKIDLMKLVSEGRVCEEMISLYQNDGIITEPAGAMSVAVLDDLRNEIKGKKVVCIVSGGNNDITRYPEIMERSLVYKGLKHYFIVEFGQRPGVLREFLDKSLGSSDDITLFEYVKKSNKETGPALVGVELKKKNDLKPLLVRMQKLGIKYELLDNQSPLFRFLV